MTHGDAQPHARALNVVEVQMVQYGQDKRTDSQHGGVDIGFVQSHSLSRIMVFKVINNFPQKYGLDYFGAFLKGKEKAVIRNTGPTSFSEGSFAFMTSMLKRHFNKVLHSSLIPKENRTLLLCKTTR